MKRKRQNNTVVSVEVDSTRVVVVVVMAEAAEQGEDFVVVVNS